MGLVNLHGPWQGGGSLTGWLDFKARANNVAHGGAPGATPWGYLGGVPWGMPSMGPGIAAPPGGPFVDRPMAGRYR
jgi:hypothetical protein